MNFNNFPTNVNCKPELFPWVTKTNVFFFADPLAANLLPTHWPSVVTFLTLKSVKLSLASEAFQKFLTDPISLFHTGETQVIM